MTALPPLTGTDRDIHILGNDREDMLARLDQQVRKTAGSAPAELVDQLAALYREVALRQTDAVWWLHNLTQPLPPIVGRLFTADDKARLAQLAARR